MYQAIASIVVNNSADLLVECIQPLIAQSCRDFDILVVNNGSTDQTEQALSPFLEKGMVTYYYNTGRNLGGARGFHYGIRKEYEAGYEYYRLMDDDTVPEPQTLENLMAASKELNRHYGFLARKAL